MRILVTGFEPFGGDTANASGDVVAVLARQWQHPTIELSTEILPVTFAGAPTALAAAIARHEPDAVLCLGEAGGRSAVTPERWAVNQRSARIPDNDDQQPEGPIDGGPERLGTRLDVDAVVHAMLEAGVSAAASDDAGRFVCNATFHAVLTQFDGPAGFIHVPALRAHGHALVSDETDPVQPDPTPSVPAPAEGRPLTLTDLVTAIAAAIDTVGKTPWEASI